MSRKGFEGYTNLKMIEKIKLQEDKLMMLYEKNLRCARQKNKTMK